MEVIEMKQNVSPLVMGGIIVVVVVIIGFFAKRILFQDPNATSVPWEQTKAYKEQQRVRAMTQGGQQTPSPSAPALGSPTTQGAHPRGALAGGQ
jgi:hypothetical protein